MSAAYSNWTAISGEKAPLVYLAGASARSRGDTLTVLHGAERIAQTVHELQSTARQRVRSIVRPPILPAAGLDAVERAQLHDGVAYHVVYDRTALAGEDLLQRATIMAQHGEVARIGDDLPAKLVLVDDDAAVMPLVTGADTVRHAVLVRGRAMMDSIGQVFDEVWQAASPFAPASAEPVLVPTEQDRLVLSLLASGATDETIGRMMGASARTAHRRVRDLITRLGVQTRFQAGVRAARLGWL